VHQDGLVHISELSDNYVSNAHDVVKAGDIVHVGVLDVDAARRRIALSMKKNSGTQATAKKTEKSPNSGKGKKANRQPPQPQPLSAMAAALSQLKLKK
jgi:uncharacterized protein